MALINTTTTGVLGSTFFGDGAGDLTVQKDGVTVNKITAAPALKVKASSAQSITSATDTKVTFDSVEFDTSSCFSSNRFTPNVAGYYYLSAQIRYNGTSISQYVGYFYKNGTPITTAYYYNANLGTVIGTFTNLIYLNGTTDYVEVYAAMTATSPTLGAGPNNYNTNYFSAFLARAA